MTETQFTTEIIQLAKFFGWKVAHFGSTVKYVRKGSGYKVIPDKNAAGFPDLVLVKGSRIIFAELKLDTTKTTPMQEEWLETLRQTDAEVYLWRPKDRDSVDKTLQGVPKIEPADVKK